MKSWLYRSRKWLIAFATIAVAVMAIDCWRKSPDAHGVRSWKDYSVAGVLGVHSSSPIILEVDGKKFADVRGRAPYYLYIPELEAIFFVVDSSKPWHHFYFLKKHEDIWIGEPGSVLGYGIGYPKEDGGDVILSATPDRVVMTALGNAAHSCFSFDLSNRLVEETHQPPATQ